MKHKHGVLRLPDKLKWLCLLTLVAMARAEEGPNQILTTHGSGSVSGGILSPYPGYYSDALRRRDVEFYASLTQGTNGPVFEAVRVNPDNSQQAFPGVITAYGKNKLSGLIPGRGKFTVKFSRDGTRAACHLKLRRVETGDIAVSGRLRMRGESWAPESVTLTYGLVIEMVITSVEPMDVVNWIDLNPAVRPVLETSSDPVRISAP